VGKGKEVQNPKKKFNNKNSIKFHRAMAKMTFCLLLHAGLRQQIKVVRG
jgi:hypothetical protein